MARRSRTYTCSGIAWVRISLDSSQIIYLMTNSGELRVIARMQPIAKFPPQNVMILYFFFFFRNFILERRPLKNREAFLFQSVIAHFLFIMFINGKSIIIIYYLLMEQGVPENVSSMFVVLFYIFDTYLEFLHVTLRSED